MSAKHEREVFNTNYKIKLMYQCLVVDEIFLGKRILSFHLAPKQIGLEEIT